MQLLDSSSLTDATHFTCSPSSKLANATSESIGRDSSSSDEESGNIDQQGQRHVEKNAEKKVRGMILRHPFEIKVTMCGLLFLALVLSSLLFFYKNYNPKHDATVASNHKQPASSDLEWYRDPFDEINDPKFTLSDQPMVSLKEQLRGVLDDADMVLLEDNEHPLGRAYQWSVNDDDMENVETYPSRVQRFIMSAFYFATGGGRVSATWTFCSAVPATQWNDDDNFATVCVTEEWNDKEQKVCATEVAFFECREYYQDEDMPQLPQARWLSKVSECNWYGVSCSESGTVVEIKLPGNGLVGTLLPHIDLLTELKTLDLSGNTLVGQLRIPGELSKLEVLDVSFNRLDVDVHFGNVNPSTGLKTLKLAGNTIASTFPESILELPNLRLLDLSDTQLQGPLPATIGQVSSLVTLNLENNELNGTIPDSLWTLTNLEVLRLGSNSLSGGSLSPDVGGLVNLKVLSLSGLNLGDEIPVELGNLDGLEMLELQNNLFVGDIPSEICQISSLVEFRVDCNGQTCECCTECCTKGKCKAIA